MPKKPSNLIYAVDEIPPPGTIWLQGLQHAAVISMGWLLVALLVTSIGGTPEEAANVIRMSMIASGVATILQGLYRGPVGSGYLCPFAVGPIYVPASLLAANTGGLPMVFSMTALSGVFEGVFSRLLPKLRPLFPPEVTGLVITMVGVQMITLGVPRFMGVQTTGAELDVVSMMVAIATLLAMVVPTIWATGLLRLNAVLLGLGVGCVTALLAGVLDLQRLVTAVSGPLVSLPSPAFAHWAFDATLVPVFLIASLASALKAVGDLTLCQKINDAEWKRTDVGSVSGGVLAGSIGNFFAGLIGAPGQSTFSSSVGMSLATGATSRAIALPCGIILIGLAFLPKLAGIFTAIPEPVIGAMLVYIASYMILSGIQLLISRMLDARRIFVIGLSMIFGLGVDVVPGLYASVPPAFASIFSSSLSLSTVLVVLLNLASRIGIVKRQTLEVRPGIDGSAEIVNFMYASGSAWGARPDVIQRATAAINEFVELAAAQALATGPVQIEVRFDEFNLDVALRYPGRLMAFPQSRPSADAVVEDDTALADLAGYLIRRYADRIQFDESGGNCQVQLHFDH